MLNLVVLKFKHYFVLFLISLNLNHVLSEIIVYKNTSIEKVVKVFTDYELSIGADIQDEGIMAYIITAQPENACEPIIPPPETPFSPISNHTRFNWFVLVDRDYCVMDKKLKNVKDAGFNGVIIYNARYTQLNLPELDCMHQLIVDFPVLLVTHIDGLSIKSSYTYEKGYFAWFLNNSPFKLYPFLLPFLIVIGACICVIVSFMISQIIRCYNERKKRRRHRLAKRHLKKIPTINFKKGDHYEVCAICLDEFQEGAKLRLLTCAHSYHIKCIDPWLTQNRRNCPICKAKVVVPGITDSESENEAENERSNATERTPLLSNTSGNQNENSSYLANNFIFPIGRRLGRQGRNSSTTTSPPNNVPSASNIVNTPNATTTSNGNDLIQSIPFRSGSRRTERRKARARIVNAEINSPLLINLDDEQPTTSSAIRIDEQSTYLNRSNSSNLTTSSSINNNSTVTNNSTIINNSIASQQQSSSNYGSTSKLRRQDNIV